MVTCCPFTLGVMAQLKVKEPVIRVPGGKGQTFSLQEDYRTEVTHPGLFLSLLLLTERTPPHQEKQEAGDQIGQNNSFTVRRYWQEAQSLPCPSASYLPGRKWPAWGQCWAGHRPSRVSAAAHFYKLAAQPSWETCSALGSGRQGMGRTPRFTGHQLCQGLFTIPVPHLEVGYHDFHGINEFSEAQTASVICSARTPWGSGIGTRLCPPSKPSIWCIFLWCHAGKFLSGI